MYQLETNDAGDFWAGCADSPSLSPLAGSSLKFAIRPPSPHHHKSTLAPSITRTGSFSSGSSPSEPEATFELDVSAPHLDVLIAPADAEEDDSYWGLYSSVGGTADSTVPSPHLADGKKVELDMFGRPIASYGEVVADGFFDGHAGRTAGSDHGEEVFFSQTAMSVSDDDDGTSRYLGVGVDLVPPKVAESSSSLGLLLGPSDSKAGTTTVEEAPSTPPRSTQTHDPSTKSSEEGLRLVIKGIYSMWLSHNAGRSMEEFMSTVKQTVEEVGEV